MALQREYKKLHGEHLGLRKAHEDALEVIEGLRRDLKHAQDEIAELGDALRAKDATIADLYKVGDVVVVIICEINRVFVAHN